jgi:hypothetical protein
MESSFEGVPQLERALKSSLVETWRNSEALKNSYENIKLLFEEENSWIEFFIL